MINHLWQSTVFAVVAALLAWVLRTNRAPVRYWIWFSASLKFLVPFALLMSLGGAVHWAPAKTMSVAPTVAFEMVQIAAPFPETVTAKPFARVTYDWVPVVLLCLWACGFAAIALLRLRDWLRIRAAVRQSSPLNIPVPVSVRASPGLMEPGVVGVFRPVLLLPDGIAAHLTPAQLEAVIAHERCHVRRRDNLFAAIHMIVEAVFWFHPLVWWIGARLVEERERACDEEVLRLGSEPRVYAEGIVNVCKLYVESPLTCVAGVTGSDIKRRIEAIMRNRTVVNLSAAKRLALASAGVLALAVPIVIGVVNAPTIQAQNAPANTPRFEVASIRACPDPSQQGPMTHIPGANSSPGRLAMDCSELLNLIGNAYTAFADGHFNRSAEPTPITGGPSWLRSAFYEINAKAEGNPSFDMMRGPMMQRLLEDRFRLKIHRQTSEGPVYFLTVARGGPKLSSFTEGSCKPFSTSSPPPIQPNGEFPKEYCKSMIYGIKPAIEAQGGTLDEFSKMLRMVVGRPVIDKTGIAGRFNIRVEFAREGTELAAMALKGPPPASDPAAPPSIFTAIQEQLGLKLESGRGPVDTLVIDHIERPSEN